MLEAKEKEVGPEAWATIERFVLLRTIDSLWVEHLTELDDMRRGIGLRGYAQQDPLNEFGRRPSASTRSCPGSSGTRSRARSSGSTSRRSRTSTRRPASSRCRARGSGAVARRGRGRWADPAAPRPPGIRRRPVRAWPAPRASRRPPARGRWRGVAGAASRRVRGTRRAARRSAATTPAGAAPA